MKFIKNNLKKGIYLLVTVSFFFGCQIDDLQNENELTLESLLTSSDKVENLLVGTYVFSGSGNLYGGQMYLASELIGNTDELEWRGTFDDGQQYIDKSINTTNGMCTDLFSDAYDVINEANAVLFGVNLDLFSSQEQDRKNRIEGEAKFLRALNHFDLVRYYAKQYIAGQTNNQIGISILLTSSINEFALNSRNTVEEAYNQVIEDLLDAINLLPNTNGVFADKFSAKSLLARVYLQKQDYENALDLANQVITESNHSLVSSFSDEFGNTSNTSEDLFSIQVNASSNTTNSMTTFWATQANGGRIGNPDTAINSSFINSYDANDDRGSFFYTNGTSGTATTKWKQRNTNVPVIRLAEMYLIRAESNFRLDTSIGSLPIDDINIIRNRSNATSLNTIDLSSILRERKFELAFEGHLLHDIKRLGLNAGTLNSNDNKLIMPIPQEEINNNSNTIQNSGY